MVHHVLEAIIKCAMMGIEYDGGQHMGSGSHNSLIMLNSTESQIIADRMEQGLGLRQTTTLVNEYCIAIDKSHIGVSTVYSTYLQLNPVVTPISAVKQGNTNPDLPWAKACLGWVTQ